MTSSGVTTELATGYAAALKALRCLDTSSNSATHQTILHGELDRADTAIAASPTGPGASELRELLTAIRRHSDQRNPVATIELARAFHKARRACACR